VKTFPLPLIHTHVSREALTPFDSPLPTELANDFGLGSSSGFTDPMETPNSVYDFESLVGYSIDDQSGL
jgi:hypothetical protein